MADAPLQITVSLPGQEPVRVALSRFNENIADWTNYWNGYFKPAWYRHVTAHYETQGASTGSRWQMLSPRYDAWKQKHWPGLPIGVLTGATRESLTFPDDVNAVWKATPTALEVGTSVPHASFLQTGTKKMPARPPLRVTSDFVVLMGRLLQEFGVKEARRAGWR